MKTLWGMVLLWTLVIEDERGTDFTLDLISGRFEQESYILEYKYYYLGLPKYNVKECLERRITYSIPLKIKFVLNLISLIYQIKEKIIL